MLNLKVLDLLAFATQAGQDLISRSWFGESDLISWFWQNFVRKGSKAAARAALLQKMAEQEADNGQFDLPEVDFSTEELLIISELR
jgi:hypothetical protein